MKAKKQPLIALDMPGSTFSMRIRIDKAEIPQPGDRLDLVYDGGEIRQQSLSGVGTGNALIIDQAPDVARLEELMLSQFGWRAWQRRSLKDAILHEVEHPLDVLVVDLERCTGSEIASLKALRERHPRAGLILTATGVLAADPRLGDHVLLCKPFTVTMFLTHLAEAMTLSQARVEHEQDS